MIYDLQPTLPTRGEGKAYTRELSLTVTSQEEQLHSHTHTHTKHWRLQSLPDRLTEHYCLRVLHVYIFHSRSAAASQGLRNKINAI